MYSVRRRISLSSGANIYVGKQIQAVLWFYDEIFLYYF